MQRDPAQEEIGIGVELRPCRRQVLAHEQQPRRAHPADERDVVLAEDPAPRVPGREPGLGPDRGAGAPAGDRPERPGSESSSASRRSIGSATSARVASAFAAQARRSSSSGAGGSATSPRPAYSQTGPIASAQARSTSAAG